MFNFPSLSQIRYNKIKPFGLFMILLLPFLVLFSGLGITYQFWLLAVTDAKYDLQRDFDAQAKEIEGQISDRLKVYAQVLYSERGLFIASEEVNRSEFKTFVETLYIQEFYPGIQGVGFTVIVPVAEKDSHIAKIRAEGFPYYHIRPEGERKDFYTSIIYLEPFEKRNLRAFGYDMYSEPVRRNAMDKAANNNTVALSGKVKLVQETKQDVQAGFLMYLPLYRKNIADLNTIEKRRANLIAWVYEPLRAKDFIYGIFPDAEESNLEIEIYDGQSISNDAALFKPQLHSTKEAFLFYTTRLIAFGQHHWTVVIHSRPAFENKFNSETSDLIIGMGISTSIMLSFILSLLINGRNRALHLADKMNQAFAKSEQHYRNTFEFAPIGVVNVSLTANFLEVNQSFCDFSGYSRTELLSMNVMDVTFEMDKPQSIQFIKKLLAGEISNFRLEKRYLRKDRKLVWGGLSARLNYNRDGSPDYVICTIEDISERKRIENELISERYRLSEIIRGTNVGTWEWNVQTGETIFNEHWANLIGYTIAELAPINIETWVKFAHPDDLKLSGELLEKHFNGELNYYEFESRMLHKAGYWIWVLDRGCVSSWTNDGKPLLMSGTHQDITTRKHTEAKLKLSERRSKVLLELANHANTLTEAHLLQTTLNQAESVTGSCIAYAHFVNDDQKTLTLGTWSTQTMLRCNTLYTDHYPISSAGIWADCFWEKRGIIVNDYPAHAIKKGLPEGHVKLLRVMNVPVLDGGAVRMIIGVGNKAEAYTQEDLIELELIAASLWSLIVRKRSEIALREAEEKYRTIADFTYDWETWTNPEGKYLYISPSCERVTGYSVEAFIADPQLMQHIIYPDDRTPVVEHFHHRYIPDYNEGKIEFRILTKTGEIRWIEHVCCAVITKDGEYLGRRANNRDITERKRAEQDLRESEGRFRLMADSAPVLIWIAGLDKQCFWFNKVWLDFTGHTMEQEIGNGWTEGVHPDDLQHCIDTYVGHFERRQAFTMEYRLKHHSGEYRWITDNGIPRFSNHGEFTGYIGSCIDIHERKQIESALRRSEAMLRTIYDLLPIGLSITDPHGHIIDCNNASETLLGITKAEHLRRDYAGKDWSIVGLDGSTMPAEEYASVRAMREQNTVRDVEMGIVKPTGTTWISVSAMPSTNPDYGVIIAYVDITAKVEANAILEQTNKILQQRTQEAQAANFAKSAFLANMSHEIRTPMNAVLGLLQLLTHTQLSTQQADYVNKAHTAAQSLLGILNDILDFSKIEAGKLVLENSPFDLHAIFNSLSVILATTVKDKNVEILFCIDASLPATVIGDGLRLQQVLLNLASNAVKFTECGEVVLRVNVLYLTAENVRVEFMVRDSGIGISQDKLATIFEGFNQAEVSTTRRFGGTGLGLTISQRLVRLMGSELMVKSTVGVGSHFYFTIDFLCIECLDCVPPQHLLDLEHLSNLRILVVDDNEVARIIITHMLIDLGWQTQSVSSGLEALELLQHQKANEGHIFDLIILDAKMPILDGWNTARRIRVLNLKKRPLIIMLTVYGPEVLQEHLTKLGDNPLDDFLTKPVTPTILFNAVVNVITGVANKPSGIALSKDAVNHLVSNEQPLLGLRILLVEDNATNQQIAGELLTLHGAQISTANNGKEGVLAVVSAPTPFDAVLMDVQMPVMDGYEATRMLRKKHAVRELPIIAMTANAMASDQEACLAAGMNAHVAKPFDIKELTATILRCCKRHQPISHTQNRQAFLQSVAACTTDNIPGFDVTSALTRLGNKSAVYLNIINSFKRDQAIIVTRLGQLLQVQDLAGAARELHTLKGISGAIGATRLFDFASSSEKLLRTGRDTANIANVKQGLDNIIIETLAGLEMITDRLTGHDADHAQPNHAHSTFDPNIVLDYIEHLEPLLQQNNLRALTTYTTMKQECEPMLGSKLEPLDIAMSKLDFAAALTAINLLKIQVTNDKKYY